MILKLNMTSVHDFLVGNTGVFSFFLILRRTTCFWFFRSKRSLLISLSGLRAPVPEEDWNGNAVLMMLAGVCVQRCVFGSKNSRW